MNLLNIIYRLSNALIAVLFAAITGWAVYDHAPAFWGTLDATFAAAGAVVILVLALAVGFCTMEAREA